MSRGIGITESLREILPAWADWLFAGVTLLGDAAFIVLALAGLYLADVLSSLDDEDRSSADPLCSDRIAVLIAAVFGGLALAVVSKAIFGLPRPPSDLHVVPQDTTGFPSGHALGATVFWGAVALFSRAWTTRGRVALAVSAVLLVALSRLALGVHFLVDVVASVAFGTLYLTIVVLVARDRPGLVFVGAIAIASLGVVLSGGGEDALLALTGTIIASLAWQLVDSQPVRKRLLATNDSSSQGQ